MRKAFAKVETQAICGKSSNLKLIDLRELKVKRMMVVVGETSSKPLIVGQTAERKVKVIMTK